MSSQKKVVKFKKRKTINIGIIVFLILFLYIAINVSLYFTKKQLSIYEVHEGNSSINKRITGLVLRKEQVFYAENSGYIFYFQKEGARIAKNASVYSIDDQGVIYSVVANKDIPITVSQKHSNDIKQDIRKFQKTFSDDDFTGVYDFKEEAQNVVLDILNTTIISQGQALLEETGMRYAFNMSHSVHSGMVSYYMDQLEAAIPEQVTADMYQMENYKRTSLRTTEMIATGSPVYKLVTSDVWNIVLPLSKEQYEALEDKTTVSFKVLKDDIEIRADLDFMHKDKDPYAVLTMDKHISNYLEDRYLEIELDFNFIKGLKIPNSAIVEKDFYMVPLDYFSFGADSTKEGLTTMTYSKNGDITYSFVPTDKYFEDDYYAYVDTILFEEGTVIHSALKPGEEGKTEPYELYKTGKLTGVYNVNQGYAVFRRIEVLDQNEEYSIVSDSTPFGLAAYDQIVLDGLTAVDQAIIY